jgi:hypothetical protein
MPDRERIQVRRSEDDLADINLKIAKIEKDLQEIIEIYRNAKGAVWVFKWLTIVTAGAIATWSWITEHFAFKG